MKCGPPHNDGDNNVIKNESREPTYTRRARGSANRGAMASVTSLGIHRPSALPFLVAEGILPTDPPDHAFTWHTFKGYGLEEDSPEEELVTTKHCVVWSKGGVVQRSYRFDAEGEPIVQAVFTHFRDNPSNDTKSVNIQPTPALNDSKRTEPKSGELTAEKQPESGLNSTHADAGHERNFQGSASTTAHEQSERSRALVVVLRTQAHIFFLAGTSHIIHLPFEVDAVFPFVYGILLQRKLPHQETISPTPQLPSVPNNSFTLSPLEHSSSSQTYRLADISTAQDSSSSVSRLLQNLLQRSKQAPSTDLSRTYCLSDPLIEISTVVMLAVSNAAGIALPRRQRSSIAGDLDSKENLLYVSSEDELGQQNPALSTRGPLVLAVTENSETRILSVWHVSSVSKSRPANPQYQNNPNASGTFSRRRSSHGPSIITGSTTPIARGTASARESFGGVRSRRHTSKDPTTEEVSLHQQEDLLDPAFENPAMPAKSSRRISSLLARADLSTNHDRTTFSDLAGAHTVTKSGRRGPSYGAHITRLSADLDTGANSIKSPTLHGIRSSLDSVSLHETQYEEMMEDDDDIQKVHEIDDTFPDKGMRNLPQDMIFSKVYSMPSDDGKLQTPPGSTSRPNRDIFMMRSPGSILGDAFGDATIVMVSIDRSTHEKLVLQINVRSSRASKGTWNTDLGIIRDGYVARVTGMTRKSGVTDACIIGDGPYRRILVLDHNDNSMGDLSLQAPWSRLRRIQLPSSLNVYNPYRITNDPFLRKRREGGFRRVMSRGPKPLVALQHSNYQGCVDVVDSEGIRHRLQVQLRPRNAQIRKIIRVTESVLPASNADGEAVIRGWWDTMSWLQARSEEEVDIEWTALIIILFSMAVEFIRDRRTEPVTRQKRRKGALLRSSSGANTNLESWEAMMSQEGGSSGPLPPWMKVGAWDWTRKENILPLTKVPRRPKSANSFTHPVTPAVPVPAKSAYLVNCISFARDFIKSSIWQDANGEHGYLPTASSKDPDLRRTALPSILVGLHLLREDFKLDVLAAEMLHRLTPVLAQIGNWLGWEAWGIKETSYYMLESTDMEAWLFEDSIINGLRIPPQPSSPPSILQHLEMIHSKADRPQFMSLGEVTSSSEAGIIGKSSIKASMRSQSHLTPRTTAITNLLTSSVEETVESRVMQMASWGMDLLMLETLPEGVTVPFRAAIMASQDQPSSKWDSRILQMIGREDVATLEHKSSAVRLHGRSSNAPSHDAVRDAHGICHSTLEVEALGAYDGSAELDRQSVTRLLFKEDQRFAEAAKLVHPLIYPIARCTPEPQWSDTDLLEAQQELVKVVAVRTLSVSTGRGLLFYNARLPLLTEKFPIHGFTLSCVMKPADTTVTADRTNFNEEKTSWAFFHAGVEAGLSISKDAEGVDTSWILFNKPRDLTTRHAGFLLALGLNGHLKNIAKWVAFKYLTPKHAMTSIGLLLGLSASYFGTMDTLITRLLSVHVTRMLPTGAAELNLSPLTQTSGIMGIGLLYCNTQHRRMSEIMLSEMENVDQDDDSNPLEDLRDEGYRLAAGFALGYINLGRGRDLRGLHDMQITERLLVLAISTRKVSVVHILDKATAAATVAIALVFLKTQDEALARKVDIPDTLHQFDYVRPDIFLLRTVARHFIMWDHIQGTLGWMKKQLPLDLQPKVKLRNIRLLTSEDMPFFNIVAGLCLSIGLRHAGSGSPAIRSLLCHFVDQFMRICRLPALNYDAQLARITTRNCQDVAALAASCVMAGTGDLQVFRRLRSLHGRTDVDTPYGSHLATHFAIGVLFMGGGTHTFGTSNVAIASLLCAFYPLFPNTVLDNKSHLQALRHFWVLATERRCLVIREIDTYRPISLSIIVVMRTGEGIAMTAPCLLPEIENIVSVRTNDPEYWSVTLDLASDPSHREAFKRHQSIYVRRRAAYDSHASVFSATMQALNDEQSAHQLGGQIFRWVFTLPAFSGFDRAERALVLPADAGNLTYKSTRGTVVDDRLVLERACIGSGRSERLWNLRILFAWAEGMSKRGEKGEWLGKETVEGLRSALGLRRRQMKTR